MRQSSAGLSLDNDLVERAAKLCDRRMLQSKPKQHKEMIAEREAKATAKEGGKA